MEDWKPPQKIEDLYEAVGDNRFSSINRPTAGPRKQEELPIGKESFQLYSLATPNGQKVGIILEELKIPYDAHTVQIGSGEQFTSGFVSVNPNSKIPCAVDILSEGKRINLFESGSILLYLSEKYQKLNFFKDSMKRAQVLNWVNWAQVQAFVTGNYGHFFVYAPGSERGARAYGTARYGMEVQRLCSVLERHLEDRTYMVGEEYTIADIAIFPWFQLIRSVGYHHDSGVKTRDFLSTNQYKYLNLWADRILQRKEVQRGMLVCRKKKFPKAWMDPKDTRFLHLLNEEERRSLESKL